MAEVADGVISDWQVHEIAWDIAHDQGTHGSHHARIARFFKEQGIEAGPMTVAAPDPRELTLRAKPVEGC